MALKFKRALQEWETAKKSVESRIESDTGSKVTLALDEEGIKALEGTTEWTNSTQIGRNEATALMFKDQALNYYLAFVYGFEWEGKLHEPGKKIFADQVEKIVFSAKHVDGADHRSKAACHHFEKEGKTWKWTVDIDYTSYIGQYPAEVRYVIRDVLESAGTQYHYLHRKMAHDKKHQEIQARQDQATAKPLALVVDYDGISKLTGTSVLSNDIKEPASGCALYAIGESTFMGICWAIEKVCKDELGKEAIAETFTAIVIHAEAGAKDIDMRDWKEHKLEKQGSELHLTMRFDFSAYINQSFPYDGMASAIEALL